MSSAHFKKTPIKLGILGVGSFVQRRVLPILKDVPSIQVTCLYKQNFTEAKQIAAQFGIPYAVSSREELINHPKVEAVLIATPNHCHEEDAIACSQVGKPTLCEKPLAPTSQSIIRMQQSFAEHNVPLFVGQSLRFKPSIQKAKKLLKGGSLGNLLHIRAYFTIPVPSGNWRYKKSCGGGVLQDIGVHLIDLIHYISGEKISSVHAIANPTYKCDSSESEYTVVAFGRLNDEANFSFECSMNQPLRSGFEIIGTKSRLISSQSLRQAHDSGESLCHVREDDSLEHLPLKVTNIYADELTHFAQVMRGEVSPLISSSVGLCNQRVIDAAYESIHSKQMIPSF